MKCSAGLVLPAQLQVAIAPLPRDLPATAQIPQEGSTSDHRRASFGLRVVVEPLVYPVNEPGAFM